MPSGIDSKFQTRSHADSCKNRSRRTYRGGELRYAKWMNRHRRLACLLLIAISGAWFRDALAQSAGDVNGSLLRTTIEKYVKAKDSKTRFTYLELVHTQNYNEKGKKTVDYTELFDVTYIADLQFARLLEVDGKALKGRALEAEQKRYDDAVRDRSALDGFARAKIQHQKMLDAGVSLGDLITEYRTSAVDHATKDDCNCVVIDLVPISSDAKRNYRVWIDPGTNEIRRVDFDQLADSGDVLRGGTSTQTFEYLDDVPLPVHSHFDGNAALNNKMVRIVADHTYSRYRKFSVTTTILPVAPGEKQ